MLDLFCDRTLLERMKELAYKDKESAIYKHLDSCYDKAFLTSQSNTQLTDLVLRRKSNLNNGLKAGKELQLFS